MRVDTRSNHILHHCKMLQVLVRLEQCVARVEFDEDASYAPYIARKGPTQTEDDLGRAVVPSRHDGRVILILEGCTSKVNQSDFGVQENASLRSMSLHRRRRGRNLAVVCERLVCRVDQQDILWLEVCMNQIQVMQDCN